MQRPFIPLRDPREQGQRVDAHKCLSYKLYLYLKLHFKKLVPLLFLKGCEDCCKALEEFQEENWNQ